MYLFWLTFLLKGKNGGLWDHLSACVSVPLWALNQVVYFYEIQYGGHAIEGDLGATLLIP
jgi:hypothetical protein